MNCDEIENLLIGHLANVLDKEETGKLELHLASCRKCQKRLEELKKAKEVFGQWKILGPPPDLKHKILNNVTVQRLFEEKGPEIPPRYFSMEKMLEWLRKRVSSEQIRIYKIVTDFLGREKGEEVFEYYLQMTVKDNLLTPPQIISQSLGLEIERIKLEGGITRETVRNCSLISMAEELGMKASPCEAICRRQVELLQKLYSVTVERIKKLPNQEGVCIFHYRPLEPPPSR